MISDIFWFIVKCKKTFTTSIHACTNKALKNTPNNSKEERRGFVPMAGVASVCLPTNWAGPSPSRKSLNWLLAPRFTPEKIKLPQKTQNSPLLTLKITNLYTNVSSVLLMAPLSQHMWWIHFAASRRISLALIIYNKKKYLRDCPSDRKQFDSVWVLVLSSPHTLHADSFLNCVLVILDCVYSQSANTYRNTRRREWMSPSEHADMQSLLSL